MDVAFILSYLLFYLMGAVTVLAVVAAYQTRPSVTKDAKPTTPRPTNLPSRPKPTPPAIRKIVEGGKPKT